MLKEKGKKTLTILKIDMRVLIVSLTLTRLCIVLPVMSAPVVIKEFLKVLKNVIIKLHAHVFCVTSHLTGIILNRRLEFRFFTASISFSLSLSPFLFFLLSSPLLCATVKVRNWQLVSLRGAEKKLYFKLSQPEKEGRKNPQKTSLHLC